MTPGSVRTVGTATGFRIDLASRPGSLQEVTRGLAKEDVNIRSVSGVDLGRDAVAILLTDNDAATHRVLEALQVPHDAVELVTVDLEDRPGALDEVLMTLAHAGVNIQAIAAAPEPMVGPAFVVADATRVADLIRS